MDKEMLIEYSCYNDKKEIQHSFVVSPDATWCELLEEFNNFLGAMGYTLPDAMHALEETYR